MRLGLWPRVLTQGDRFEEFSGIRGSELCKCNAKVSSTEGRSAFGY